MKKPRGFALSPTALALVNESKVAPKEGQGEKKMSTPDAPTPPPSDAPESGQEPAVAHQNEGRRETDRSPEPAPAATPAPAPAPQPEAPKRNPWEEFAGEPKGLNFKPDEELHAKMEWVCNNVPRMSRLRILRDGAAMLCDMLIEKHYKP